LNSFFIALSYVFRCDLSIINQSIDWAGCRVSMSMAAKHRRAGIRWMWVFTMVS